MTLRHWRRKDVFHPGFSGEPSQAACQQIRYLTSQRECECEGFLDVKVRWWFKHIVKRVNGATASLRVQWRIGHRSRGGKDVHSKGQDRTMVTIQEKVLYLCYFSTSSLPSCFQLHRDGMPKSQAGCGQVRERILRQRRQDVLAQQAGPTWDV